MQHTAPATEMSQVELGKTALATLKQMFRQHCISLGQIRDILISQAVYAPDISKFIAQLIHETGWWERRREELARQILVYLMGRSTENKILIVSLVQTTIPDRWMEFTSGCLKLIRKPRHARASLLEL